MQILTGPSRDLGDGFSVARVLPQAARRAIGPFVFFDYFGPVAFAPGKGLDVRPHPHIGLATVTYLFEGAIDHRDSIGSVQTIAPGAVNWMTAGRGIVHSERTGPEARASGHRVHGIQSWIGLPAKDEETAPTFVHASAKDLPSKDIGGANLRIVAGTAFGLRAPVPTFSPIFYADAKLAPGAAMVLENEYPERAAFVVDGLCESGGAAHGRGTMILFGEGEEAQLSAPQGARVMLLGGAALDGPRHVWWNFVSSSKDRIERAKKEWRDNPQGHIEGDNEFIPLPD